MEDFFKVDPQAAGSKGLVYIGDKIIVYRRSQDAPVYAGAIDVPGGGLEAGETPFETFKREVKEEFGLDITTEHIVYARRYASAQLPGKFGWFAVAKLPAAAKELIVFGDEGDEYMLMTVEEYLALTNAWPVFQDRTRDYLSVH
jgi:8-oxo-dGTP diphosphatase